MTLSAPSSARPFAARLADLWRRHRGWLWREVLLVFLLTRGALLAIAVGAEPLRANPDYPVGGVPERGWQFTPVRLVDVWARWDSGWYFDLIWYGYRAPSDMATVESNLAFFPLYPYLVRTLTLLVPPALASAGATLLLGVLASNALLLGALALLRQWVRRLTGDEGVARRTVLYLLLFPTGFFFSAFYTESTFLFFSMAALFAAQRRAWGWACVAGTLLTLTRPLGILIAVPLAWQYAEAAGWNIRRLRWDAAWFALMPAAFVSFGYWLSTLTGDPLTLVHVRQAWARGFAWPWESLLHPTGLINYMTSLDQAATLAFVAGALLALRRLPSPSLGLYALLLVVPQLFTGQVLSMVRYVVVVIPVFVLLAQFGRRPAVDQALTLLLPMGQALLFVLWCRFYWVA